jgi:hypothetical protein
LEVRIRKKKRGASARRPRMKTPTMTSSVIIDTKTPYPQDATARRPRTKTPTTTTPSTQTVTTPSTTQRRPTSSSSFHLRKKKRGTRYPSPTGKTLSTTPPTPSPLFILMSI